MESKREGINWSRGAAIAICLAAILGVAWLLGRYVLGVAIPFLVAYLLSRLIRPLIDRICRGRIPRGPVAALLVVLFVGITVFLAYRGIRRGISELERLALNFTADGQGVTATISTALERARTLSSRIPILRKFENAPGYEVFCERVDGLVEDGLSQAAQAVTQRLPSMALSLAQGLPAVLVSLAVLLLACYYFSADDGCLREGASALATRWIPAGWREAFAPLWNRVRRLGRQYLRACLYLGLITFLLAFIGLAVLGVPYAFLLAALIAVVDFLPLLGSGTVLAPWAIVCFLLGKTGMGIGLLVLWGVCALVRQLLEPKLIGGGLGLHPLVSLVAMYAGLRLFGVAGMILAPLGAGVARSLLEN